MTTSRVLDMSIIDHTNEDLIRWHFIRLAEIQGVGRRAAEILFRNKWDKIKRTISPDRNLTYLSLTLIIVEATK